jgi:hypothetical protein
MITEVGPDVARGLAFAFTFDRPAAFFTGRFDTRRIAFFFAAIRTVS